jgi:hypothetical protein
MLDRCRARAAERGLQVALHRAEMQSFSLGRRYRSIFLAGASFTLLTRDEDAACALERIHEHLEPGGSALIPLSLENRDFESMKKVLGRFTEVTTGPGDRLRVGLVALDRSVDGRSLTRRLRYERIPAGGAPEVVERDWLTRHWSQGEFEGMLAKAGFGRATFVKPEGGRSGPEDASFVALVSR